MRKIDWNKPLSEEDKGWALQRDMHEQVAANEAKFKTGTKKPKAAEGPEAVEIKDDYDSWKLNELKEEAANREGLVTTGMATKADYIAALRTWDAENPEADAVSDDDDDDEDDE